jgi:hypothetical protein
MSSRNLTRLSGCLAVFALCLTLLALLNAAAEAITDRAGSPDPVLPSFLSFTFNFAPIGFTWILQPGLLAVLYWRLSSDRPPPLHHMVWHFLALGVALMLLVAALFLTAHTHLDGDRPVTAGRWAVNAGLSVLLFLGVHISYRRR